MHMKRRLHSAVDDHLWACLCWLKPSALQTKSGSCFLLSWSCSTDSQLVDKLCFIHSHFLAPALAVHKLNPAVPNPRSWTPLPCTASNMLLNSLDNWSNSAWVGRRSAYLSLFPSLHQWKTHKRLECQVKALTHHDDLEVPATALAEPSTGKGILLFFVHLFLFPQLISLSWQKDTHVINCLSASHITIAISLNPNKTTFYLASHL